MRLPRHLASQWPTRFYFAVSVACTVLGLGCAASDADVDAGRDRRDSGPPPDMCATSVEDVDCSCDNGHLGLQLEDCRGNALGACECPVEEACDAGAGCIGSTLCTELGGCGQCGGCFAGTDDTGFAKAFSVAPNGDAFVLLTAAPWIVRHTASAATALTVQGDLGFATSIVALDDSLLLVGVSASPANSVTIQRLSHTGALLGTTTWSVPQTSGTAGVFGVRAQLLSNGSVVVVAARYNSVSFGTISETPTVTDVDTVMTTNTGLRLTDLDEGLDGTLVLGGYLLRFGRVEGTWFARISQAGVMLGERSEDRYDLFTPYGYVAESAAGQTFAGWSWRFTDREPLDLYARRFDSTLMNPVWSQLANDQGETLLGVEFIVGSVVFATRTQLFRTDAAGSYPLQRLALPANVLATDARGNELFLLTNANDGSAFHSVQRAAFSPVGAAGAGSSCGVDGDCQSGKCCVSGNPRVGVCSATAQCPNDAVCTAANACAEGGCLMLGAAGVCATRCAASSDCPSSYFCGEADCGGPPCLRYCLRDCTSGGASTCTSIDSTLSCDMMMNAENVPVSLCR
jgi:hypothetical protein